MGMSSHPDWDWVEVYSTDEGVRPPAIHTEGTAFGENPTVESAARDVFGDEALFGAGLQKAWDELTPDEDSQGAFIEAYSSYVSRPEELEQQQPDRFGFIKDHVFYTSPGVTYPDPSSMVKGLGTDASGRKVDSLGYPR